MGHGRQLKDAAMIHPFAARHTAKTYKQTHILIPEYAKMRNMQRTNFYFPLPMLDQLREASAKHGLPVSEIIRRAITAWLSCN